MPSGTVAELWRFPVKSMRGERVDALRLDARGAAGDRTHAVWHEHKGRPTRLTARESPGLLAWTATYEQPGATLDPAEPPPAVLLAPDGTRHASDAGGPLTAALANDLGRPILQLRRDPAGQQDLERSLLITTQASHEALERELGRPVDPRRWRTNLHLVLDDVAPWEELGWEGGTVRLDGGIVLRLLHPCERCAIPTRDPDTQAKDPALLKYLVAHHDTCFGINARVETGGTLHEGAAVHITKP